ncbi:helix-turn-helix domain-containing protein [Brevibacterium litoralis]|uniref:helix-turn-helix domain-containing protein n=1 Tax=Brevibacterium litoralis TaxID=3138935 RepID=UPI0032EE262E
MGKKKTDLERRVARLESTVADLADLLREQSDAGAADRKVEAETGATTGTGGQGASGAESPFFAVEGLKALPGLQEAGGGVLYAGVLGGPDRPPERRLEWQYARPADHLEQKDFAASAASLAALASPVRLSVLQAVYAGVSTVAELAESGEYGSTGQIYHHINALASAGWLHSPRRGRWEVPEHRVIPLLTLVLVTQE